MFHLSLKKYHNLNELFREMGVLFSIISGHIVMYGIKLWSEIFINVFWSVQICDRKASSVQNVIKNLARHLSST